MREIDLLQAKHVSVRRDYLARVNDPEFPKHRAAELAKKWDFEYWDGDRRICYGGYNYKPGYWTPVAERLIEEYNLTSSSSVLDIGCGKGYLLYEIALLLPGIKIAGIDISNYAIENSHPEIKRYLRFGSSDSLPWQDGVFDLAFTLNTFHNLYTYQLFPSFKEIKRVSKASYVCVESYRNELEKQNLLYWQVTCEAFLTPREWLWWFDLTGYDRDYGFIYFE
jgi:protein-L-isoaspartate(D-aspartate) O-methyltransferase